MWKRFKTTMRLIKAYISYGFSKVKSAMLDTCNAIKLYAMRAINSIKNDIVNILRGLVSSIYLGIHLVTLTAIVWVLYHTSIEVYSFLHTMTEWF